MKKYLSVAAGLLTSATLILAAAPAQAGPVHIDLNIGIPVPVLVQPGPVYVQPDPGYFQPRGVVIYNNPGYYGYQQPWRERDWRDYHWYDRNHYDNRRAEHHDHGGNEHRGHER